MDITLRLFYVCCGVCCGGILIGRVGVAVYTT